jgi:hypothetical protein
MALALDTSTEAILNVIFKELNAETLRVTEVPRGVLISDQISFASNAAGTEVFVYNPDNFPSSGYLNFSENNETVFYDQKRLSASTTVTAGASKKPILKLTAGTALANNHAAGGYVWLMPAVTVNSVRTFAAGSVGVHNIMAFLRQLIRQLTPVVLQESTGAPAADAYTINDNLAYVANTLHGNTVTIVTDAGTPANVGMTCTIASNTASAITLATPLSAVLGANATYQINTTHMDDYITQFEHNLPAHNTLTNSASDVGRNPGELATCLAGVLVNICDQYDPAVGVTRPTSTAATMLFAHNSKISTMLAKAAAAADLDLFVLDNTGFSVGDNISVGAITTPIIARLTGTTQIRLTAALGGGGGAVYATVTPTGDGSYLAGTRKHDWQSPHAWGVGMLEWLDCAVDCVEAYTKPHA